MGGYVPRECVNTRHMLEKRRTGACATFCVASDAPLSFYFQQLAAMLVSESALSHHAERGCQRLARAQEGIRLKTARRWNV